MCLTASTLPLPNRHWPDRRCASTCGSQDADWECFLFTGRLELGCLPLQDGADKGLGPFQSIDKRVGEFWLFNFHIRDRNDSPVGALFAERFRKSSPDRRRKRVTYQQHTAIHLTDLF